MAEKGKSRLSQEERQFFSLVNQAVFTNPFSDEREELDLKILGLFPGIPPEERIDRTITEVEDRINRLVNEDRADINQYSGKDRSLVESTFLFGFFHQFLEKFDLFILDQVKAEDTPIKVPFAREAMLLLKSRGFNRSECLRYFELAYQLRRVYFFVVKGLIGQSPCMKALRRSLWNNVFTHNIDLYNRYLWDRMEDFSTLILGETGTGKGTAAMAMGRSGFLPFDEKNQCFSESFCRSFVSLNLSEFPETLIESELFGHKKGAFTGAVENYNGVFDRCSPFGSIFLDEIGEVSHSIQIKLLQVIQERFFSPVGSHEKHRFQGRVIAATNRPINEIRENGILRDDFFYRLSSDIIVVPPLRQRIEEDPAELENLLTHTVERILGRPSTELVEMVIGVINRKLGKEYPWPGNVRELEQCVRRVLLNQTYHGDWKSVAPDLRSRLVRGVENGDMDAQSLLSGYCTMLYRRYGTYEKVARRTDLDRRTVKKYIMEWED